MDNSREEFENWAEEAGALPWGYLKRQRNPRGGYSVQIYTYMWAAWQASRKALVVELPGKISQQNMFNGRALPEAESYDEAIEDCADAIRDAGITVKGDE